MLEHHDGWVVAAPSALIANDRPEVVLAGFTSARGQDRHRGFVRKEPIAGFQLFNHGVDDRGNVESDAPGPIGQHGSVDFDAVAAPDLGLSVKRKMITKLRDHGMNGEPVRVQATRGPETLVPVPVRGISHRVCGTCISGAR